MDTECELCTDRFNSSALLIAICKLGKEQADDLRLKDVHAESLEVFCPVRRLCKAN